MRPGAKLGGCNLVFLALNPNKKIYWCFKADENEQCGTGREMKTIFVIWLDLAKYTNNKSIWTGTHLRPKHIFTIEQSNCWCLCGNQYDFNGFRFGVWASVTFLFILVVALFLGAFRLSFRKHTNRMRATKTSNYLSKYGSQSHLSWAISYRQLACLLWPISIFICLLFCTVCISDILNQRSIRISKAPR